MKDDPPSYLKKDPDLVSIFYCWDEIEDPLLRGRIIDASEPKGLTLAGLGSILFGKKKQDEGWVNKWVMEKLFCWRDRIFDLQKIVGQPSFSWDFNNLSIDEIDRILYNERRKALFELAKSLKDRKKHREFYRSLMMDIPSNGEGSEDSPPFEPKEG